MEHILNMPNNFMLIVGVSL